MGMIYPTLDNRVRFTLYNDNLEPLEITDPIGWETDEKETVRNGKYDGIYSQFSNNLQFIGTGAAFIILVDDLYGINASIRLVRDEKHPKTDIWTRSYDTFLDLTTLDKKDGVVKIKANAGGLEKRIKAKEGENVELERLETLDGKAIPPLSINRVALDGRQVFLDSLLAIDDIDKKENYLKMRASDGYNIGQLTIPMAEKHKSDELVHGVYRGQYYEGGNTVAPGRAETLVYAVNDRRKTLHINFKHKSKVVVDSFSPAPSSPYLSIDMIVYSGGTDYTFKSRTKLQQFAGKTNISNGVFDIDYSIDLELLEGESFAFVWVGEGTFSGALFEPNDYMYLHFDVEQSELSIKEDSFYEQSQSNVLLPYEALNRLIQIVTGRDDLLYSEALGRTDLGYAKDGIASLVGITHGFWIRNFQEGDELYKGITTSIKDFLQSYLAVFNLGMGIEVIGKSERIRVEHESYFYNRNTTARLGQTKNNVFEYIQVNELNEVKIPDLYYSTIEVGFEKPSGDRLYDEAVGLIEYNGMNTYTSCIDSVTNTLRLVSSYRGDIMATEFARRKPKELFPTADTSYDKEIIMLDMIRTASGVFRLAKWQDHFEEAPLNTYSPETAGNLRLSPFNILLRNGSKISAGLTKYPDEYLRYASSTANSNLGTKLIGGSLYVENQPGGVIKNDKLDPPRYLPIALKFNFPVDFELSQKIQGNSNILGKLVPNTYGLFEFKDRNGTITKGFLEKLKPNGKGSWELKKYSGNG